MSEKYAKLVATIYPTLDDAIGYGQFAWLRHDDYRLDVFPGAVGSVWEADEHGGHTGLPGCVETTAEYARLFAAAPDLLAVAQAYEQWEADLALSQEAWSGGLAPLPTLTQALFDRLLEIQAMRKAAIKRLSVTEK